MTDQPLFLMTDPRHFGVIYQINPWMRPDAWRADLGALQAGAVQSAARLRTALEMIGGYIETVPAVEHLPDLVFPANAAIVLNGRALVARFRHPERQGEEAVFHAAFMNLKSRGLISEVIDLPEDVLQEGAGDCIWDADRSLFWVGYGQRSTANSLHVIGKIFEQRTIGLELATDRFYHLDTCFCPLAGGKVLYYPPAFTAEALAAIHAHVRPEDRVEATEEEAGAFCVNAVNIGRHIVMAKAPESLRSRLRALGYSLCEVDLAPFILSGGGAYCMTLRLDRNSDVEAAMRAAE